jgi:hypothetical protein
MDRRIKSGDDAVWMRPPSRLTTRQRGARVYQFKTTSRIAQVSVTKR